MRGERRDRKYVALLEGQADVETELANIKAMLQGIATDLSGAKGSLKGLQTMIQELGGRLTKAETRISSLEDGSIWAWMLMEVLKLKECTDAYPSQTGM